MTDKERNRLRELVLRALANGVPMCDILEALGVRT